MTRVAKGQSAARRGGGVHYQSYVTRNPSKSACHEDLTPPQAGAHHTPPPAGAYYHKVSSEMQVGAEIKKAATKSDVDLAFGCLYKLDKNTTVKGKVRTAHRRPTHEPPPPRSPPGLAV